MRLSQFCMTSYRSAMLMNVTMQLGLAVVLLCCWVLQLSDATNTTNSTLDVELPSGFVNRDAAREKEWTNKLVRNIIILGIVACIFVAIFFLYKYYRSERRTASLRKRYHRVKSNLGGEGQADDDDEEIEMSIYEKK